jgi:hypothetical protein
MLLQGLGRVLRCQQGRRFTRAVLADDAHHDMAQLHFARLHPRPRLCPEHVAVRAVRVAEQVHLAWCIGLAVGDPGGFLQLRPDGLAHRPIHQLFQRLGAKVLALFVEQAADQYVLAVGGEVQGQGVVLVLGGVAAQAVGRIEAALDHGALGLQLLNCLGQFFGLQGRGGQQGQGQGQQCSQSHVSFLVRQGRA